jgi:hypothetical protein
MLIALSLPLNSDDGDSGADRMRHCILIERIAPLSNERQGNLIFGNDEGAKLEP